MGNEGCILMEYMDISVVIQGAINREWYIRISSSIRQFLPGAEIIISTWIGTDVSGLDYDKIVMNNDPGAIISNFPETGLTTNNINRQIVSTRNGIKESLRTYIIKIRSDSFLQGTDFLYYFQKYSTDGQILMFEPINPKGKFKNQYCFNDFFFLGDRKRMLELWDIPLYSSLKNGEKDLLPEEYLLQAYCKKIYNTNSVNESLFLKVLREKVVIIPEQKSGIKSIKYPGHNSFIEVFIKHYFISHNEWKCITENASPVDWVVAAISRITGCIVLVIRPLILMLKGK